MITRFVLFGFLGILCMLLFTAIKGAIAERKYAFTGEASLILFPAFGLIAVLYPIIAIHTGSYSWYLRGAIYMIVFYTVQYAVGWLLTRFNACPWQYSGGGAINGLVRLYDAPLWFGAGLGVERIYPYVKVVANSLG